MQTDFKLYKVDMKYIRNLHNIDDKVLSVLPQADVQELEWCQNNSEAICNKANVLYKKYISNESFTGRNHSLYINSCNIILKESIRLRADKKSSRFFWLLWLISY